MTIWRENVYVIFRFYGWLNLKIKYYKRCGIGGIDNCRRHLTQINQDKGAGGQGERGHN